MVSLALPLFIVTMASQNLPGVAAIKAAGYSMPLSKIITMTGLATLVLAPFGAFALNLSAITAAICMGREAHPDPTKRYTAAVSCGAIYIVIGLLGGAFIGILMSFPKELIAAIAGLALLGTIGNGLALAVQDVAPVPTSAFPTPATRPLNSRLNTTHLRQTFGLVLPDWQRGVRRMLSEIL